MKRLLEITNPINNVLVEDLEEEEDSDFDSRLEEMIAEEERNRKKGRRTKASKGIIAANAARRRSGRRSKKEEQEMEKKAASSIAEPVLLENVRSLDVSRLSPVITPKAEPGLIEQKDNRRNSPVSTLISFLPDFRDIIRLIPWGIKISVHSYKGKVLN